MAFADSTVRVHVTKSGDRKYLLMYYDDPITGRRVTRSTKETTQKGAEKAAAKWEAELQEGRYKPKVNVTWADFRESFMQSGTNWSKNAHRAYEVVFNAIERHLKVNRLAELTSHRITALASLWQQEDGATLPTVGAYLSRLRTALRWAHEQGWLNTLPKIKIPRGASGKMKGRPITGEEFDRMLARVESVLAQKRIRGESAGSDHSEQDAMAWKRLLQGMWSSGLRLGEALSLTWDDDTQAMVDFRGKYPVISIPATCQKAKRDTVTPIVPEFCNLLNQTPAVDRKGLVFPVAIRGRRLSENNIGRIISRIGEAAGIVVDKAAGKFASAHDLRRSFGDRWSHKVMPPVLMQLMRHERIDTTMKYYVGKNVELMAAEIWAGAKPEGQPVGSPESRPA